MSGLPIAVNRIKTRRKKVWSSTLFVQFYICKSFLYYKLTGFFLPFIC
nr:MAG TPA: hypothetical protein [Caudoviricetes sp.]